jgi:hypothetical protein
MRTIRQLSVVTGLSLLLPPAARAASLYKIETIIQLGAKVGTPPIHTSTGLWIGSLNNSGQIAFVSGDSAGGPVLFRYADNQFTPVVLAGQDAPVGKWPAQMVLWSPISMNQAGNIVFSLLDHDAGTPLGTFKWEAKTRLVTAVALKGMLGGSTVTLLDGGGPSPAINDQDEIAFVADVKNGAGETQSGVFFLGRDAQVRPVVLPDQSLPDAIFAQSASHPSVNNNGSVAFLVTRKGDRGASAYLWENSQLSPLLIAGTPAPGGSYFAAVWGAWVNNKNHNVLIEVSIKSVTAAHSLFLLAGGSLTPVAVVGKDLPDGVTLKSVDGGVSAANDAGQHVFVATRGDKSTAAYLVDAAGKLTLLVKSGGMTDLGALARVGEASTFGVSLNNQGQVALVVRFVGDRSSTLVLLTPR